MKEKIQKQIRNSLVILVWDEVEAATKLYPSIPFDAVDEAIVVDAGSTDGTVEFFEDKGLKVVHQKEKGRGRAFVMALDYTKGNNLIFFSGDGNEDPRDIPKVVKYLDEGYDMVVGGRFLLEGAKSDDSDDILRIRKWGNIAFSTLVRFVWGSNIMDAINGFRGFKREAMKKMCLDAPGHEIEFQSTIRAAKLGLKVKEFPTIELKRLGGDRKVTAKTLTLGKKFIKFFFKELFIGNKFKKN